MNLIVIAKLLIAGVLVTILWVHLLRVAVWMVQKVMEWTESESGGKKRGVIRFLWRLLLDPL